jgi:hypothetical protein
MSGIITEPLFVSTFPKMDQVSSTPRLSSLSLNVASTREALQIWYVSLVPAVLGRRNPKKDGSRRDPGTSRGYL